MGVERLRFLVGQWRGEGRVRDGRATAAVTGTYRREDGAIALVHETRVVGGEGAGLPPHRERIVQRERRGRLRAFVRPDGGAEQEFIGEVTPAGFRFTHQSKQGEVTWELTPAGEDAWSERFLVVEEGAPVEVVTLRHERAEG